MLLMQIVIYLVMSQSTVKTVTTKSGFISDDFIASPRHSRFFEAICSSVDNDLLCVHVCCTLGIYACWMERIGHNETHGTTNK